MGVKRLGITMGDPMGIGPEVVVKVLDGWRGSSQLVVWGDELRLDFMRRKLGLSVQWTTIHDIGQLSEISPDRPVVVSGLSVGGDWGRITAEAGQASYEYIRGAIAAAMSKMVSAIVTAPINKEAIHMAGIEEAGHTEIFARLCGAPQVAMMLVGGGLRVTHVSTHVSLAQAITKVTPTSIRSAVTLTWEALPKFGVQDGTIAVAGLNPHNGEHGLFGNEEDRVIGPAVEKLRSEAIPVVGPIPADTVFARAIHGEFSAVVALYHDQGHIPIKLLAFDSAVNVTLGLPIIRTSVDHGTGFDIAGQGIANPSSLMAAIQVAEQLGYGLMSRDTGTGETE